MKAVWKFQVPSTDTFSLTMPIRAQILSVQAQHGGPMIWCLVDPLAPTESRTFRLAGTGHKIEELVEYIGTFQMFDGTLVGHLFEIKE